MDVKYGHLSPFSMDAVVRKEGGRDRGSSPVSVGPTHVPMWCQFLFCLVVHQLHLDSTEHLTTQQGFNLLWPPGSAQSVAVVFQGDLLATSLQGRTLRSRHQCSLTTRFRISLSER